MDLLTPSFLQHVAICTVLVLLIALILGTHPFKKKKQPTVSDVWLADDYFKYLRSFINASKNMDELESAMQLIDTFHDKVFREPISNRQCNEYYEKLLDVYCTKEIELTTIPVQLCKN